MALDDVNFQEGEGQDFIVEVPEGTLNAPLDISSEANGSPLVSEIPSVGGIFVMMD